MRVKISVVMSTYNETETEIREAIESILNQSMKNIEFIIILDKPDNNKLKNIIEQYKKQDSRIVFIINDKNIGLAKSLNKGIDIAKGKYIARMDGDDISLPDRLEKEYNILTKNDIDIVSTYKINIDENGIEENTIKQYPSNDEDIKRYLELGSIIVHPSVMFIKEKINAIGRYRNFPVAQDYDLWCRARDKKYKFYIIPKPLLKYRVRKNNISNSNPLKQFLIKKYIIKLSKKRKRDRNDDGYDEQILMNYLYRNKAFIEKEIRKYKEGIKYLDEAKNKLVEKKYFMFGKFIIKAIFAQKEIKNVLVNSMKIHYLEKKF